MGAYIGIDLGTTFSVVAVLDDLGNPMIVKNLSTGVRTDPKGGKADGVLTPSCVLFKKDGSVVVGEKARSALQLKSEAFGRFKCEMGTSQTYQAGDKTLTPTDLSALVLKELKRVAEDGVGEIEKAVVTIPANFANEARDATMQAAKNAGLDIDVIINEPTAAALYYAFNNDKELSGNYAIYDFGGGTFDVSVVKFSGQDVDVLASNGLHKLGGDDIDKALQELIGEKYKEVTDEKISSDDYTLNQAEEDKKSLSHRSKVLAGGGEEIGDDVQITLRRVELERKISSFLSQTEMACESAVAEAGLEVGDIKDVILVGGSTRIPKVRESIERVFGKPPLESENVDEMVALGAALYAAYKSDGAALNATQRQALKKMQVAECANHYFGTIAMNISEERGVIEKANSIIIKKGQKIPCSVTKSYATMADGQQYINCTITQSNSDETDPQFVKIIKEAQLELPAGRPAGQEIQVTFSYDDSERMHCVFKDVGSGESWEVNLSSTGSDSEDDVLEKVLVD